MDELQQQLYTDEERFEHFIRAYRRADSIGRFVMRWCNFANTVVLRLMDLATA